MRSGKKPYNRIISTILVICMLIGILPQTVISLDSFSDDDTGELINHFLDESVSFEEDILSEEDTSFEEDIPLEENIAINSEYSMLKGRSKQELIIKYKDSSQKIDITEKTKDPNITSLKSKERLDSKTELMEISSKDDIGKIIDILKQDPNVEYVQPNYEVTILGIDDSYIDLQWGIKNNGQTINNNPGTAGEDINLSPILDMPYINEITVAVIDTGIEITHEDLAGKINPNGWNFAGGNNDVSDLSGHGTHIAGIIGAAKNNIGVMGVAENVKLLPLKVIENGIGYTSDVIEAIQYAESMGAKIANCSFGSEYFNYAMYEAMRDSSMAFICAAGNTGSISNIYPASYELPNVLSVTSVNNNGGLVSNASYGQSVDIAAPGVDIYSTSIYNTYTYGSGSSYAASYATGAAARLLGIRDMTSAEVITVLKQGVTKKYNLADYVKSGGMLNIYGSYDLTKDDLDIVIDIDLDSFEYDEAILQLLEKDYYAMTEEEKERLLDYFHVSRELLEECLAAGYPLSESLNYSAKMGGFGFTLNEIVTFYGMFDEAWKAGIEFSFLDTLIQRYGVSPEEITDIKALMFSGQKVKNLTKTYVASKALGISIYTLVKKDGNIGENGYMNISGTDLTDEEKKDIWIFSVNNWADVNVLIDYMTANNIPFSDIWAGAESYEDNTIIPLDGETPKKYPTAPFSYKEGTNERINLNTGSLVYENTDAVLPGKNGMDLVITSRYDSYSANIQDAYLSTPTPVVNHYRLWTHVCITANGIQQPCAGGYSTTTSYSEAQTWGKRNNEYNSSSYYYTSTSYYYETVYVNTYTTNLRQSNYDLKNNLGIGWSFGFSYIEITDGYKYLHLNDGTVYEIASTLSSSGSNLLNYSLTDIQLLQDSTFAKGQVGSYYVLKYKDGVNEYFSSDGRLLGCQDRFGNTIVFEHTLINGNYLLTKITDTLGRITTIAYTTTSAGRDVVITLPDNNKITYVLEKISGYYGTTCKLIQRKDQLNRITNFTYSPGSVSEKPLIQSTNTVTKNYINLTKVTYPTTASSEYAYTLKDENTGTTGKTQVYKVSQRLDKQSTTTYNVETYAYTGSNTAYPTYANMGAALGTYTYSTAVTNSGTGKKITTTFNKEHLPTNVTTYNSSNMKLIEDIYVYNGYKQMIKSEERTYGSNGSTYQESINNYEYDTKNNITGHWSPLAGGNITSTEYKATYTYNPTYSYITSKQYKQNSTKTVTEEYTPYTSDTKKIEWKKVYETVGAGAKTLKEATQYFYDGVGNITEERRYYGNLTTLTEYISTQYAHTYNTDGTSTTTITTLSVKNADGGLIGNIVNKYEYNKMGRMKNSTDGKGYITTYEYDLLGRQTKVINPDITSKTYAYDDTANTLTETNEKNISMKYFYDGFGNIKTVRDVTSGTDIATFEYDTAFRLKEESTLSASSTTGSKTTYTYDALEPI